MNKKNFHLFSIEKKNSLTFALLMVMASGCLLAAIPAVQEFAITFFGKHVFHREIRDIGKWIMIITRCLLLFFTVFATIIFSNFTEFGKNIWNDVRKEFLCYAEQIKKKSSLAAIGLFLLFLYIAYFKIIDADYLFQDNVFNHYKAIGGWFEFSHFFAGFSSFAFHTSFKLIDNGVLIQFLSLAVMAATISILAFTFEGTIRLSTLLLLSPIFICPFYSQNMSYRYDCLYMTFSVFFAAVPFLFYRNTKSFVFTTFVFINLSCLSYQAGTSLYIILAIFIVMQKLLDSTSLKSKDAWCFTATALFAFASSFIYYYLVLARKFAATDYFDPQPQLSSIPKNIVDYIRLTFSTFGGTWTKCTLAASAVLSMIFCVKRAVLNKTAACIVTASAFAFSIAVSYGAYIILSFPPYTPRSFIGFGCFAAIAVYWLYRNTKSKAARVFPVLLIYGCVVFLNVYGTCLSEQKHYETFREELLLSDLNRLSTSEDVKYYKIKGLCGISENNSAAIKVYPLIQNSLMCSILAERKLDWNDYVLKKYNFECEETGIPENHGMPLLVSSYYHDIYGRDNRFYIVLKNPMNPNMQN